MSVDVIQQGPAEHMGSNAMFGESSSGVQRMPSAFDNVHYRAMAEREETIEVAGKTAGEWHALKLQGLVGDYPATAGILLDVAAEMRDDLQDAGIADLPDLAREGVFGEVNRRHPDPSDIANRMFETDQAIKTKPEVAERWRKRLASGAPNFETTVASDYLDDTARARAQGETMRFLYGEDKVEAWAAEQDMAGKTEQAGRAGS